MESPRITEDELIDYAAKEQEGPIRKSITTLHEVLTSLEERVERLHAKTSSARSSLPQEVTRSDERIHGGSTITGRIDEAIKRVDTLTHAIENITAELEI